MQLGEKHHRIGLHKVREKKTWPLKDHYWYDTIATLFKGRFITISKIQQITISNDSMVGGLLWGIGLTTNQPLVEPQIKIVRKPCKRKLWGSKLEQKHGEFKKRTKQQKGKKTRISPKNILCWESGPTFLLQMSPKSRWCFGVAPGWNRGKYQV